MCRAWVKLHHNSALHFGPIRTQRPDRCRRLVVGQPPDQQLQPELKGHQALELGAENIADAVEAIHHIPNVDIKTGGCCIGRSTVASGSSLDGRGALFGG